MKKEILTGGSTGRLTLRRAILAAWVIPISLWATPPKIVVQPTSLDLAPGNAAGFLVQAEGTPPLEYRWSRDGNAVTGATTDLYYIPVSSAADAGNYRVTVSNGEGSVTSDAARLDLAPYDDPVDRGFRVTSPMLSRTVVSAVASDGTILAAATEESNYSLYRLDARGAVMTGFNPAPEVVSAKDIVGLRPLASGKILVVIKTSSDAINILRIEREVCFWPVPYFAR